MFGGIVSFGADHLCADLNYATIGESVEIRQRRHGCARRLKRLERERTMVLA